MSKATGSDKGTSAKKGGKVTAVYNTAASQPATPKHGDSKAARPKTSYKVQRGDTLMAIARKHKVDVNDVARWNSLDKNRAALKPGQELTLYLDAQDKAKR